MVIFVNMMVLVIQANLMWLVNLAKTGDSGESDDLLETQNSCGSGESGDSGKLGDSGESGGFSDAGESGESRDSG